MNVNRLAREAVRDYGAQQKPWELAQVGKLLLDRECLTAVEIGTYAGATAWFWHALGLDTVTIDRNQSHCVNRVDGIRYVEGLSGEVELPARCDFLFIDGNHTYSGVVSDWNRFKPLVCPGGMIALHDIVEHPPDQTCDVWRFWREIRETHMTVEFVDSKQEGEWGGIGVVHV